MEREKSQKIQLVYGYSVCLVAVIAFLISISDMVSSSIDLKDPINAYRTYGEDAPSLASYENYKMDALKSITQENKDEFNEATLKSMYEAAKQDAISKVNHNAFRSLIVSGLITILCIILFITHWVWMRKLSRKTD